MMDEDRPWRFLTTIPGVSNDINSYFRHLLNRKRRPNSFKIPDVISILYIFRKTGNGEKEGRSFSEWRFLDIVPLPAGRQGPRPEGDCGVLNSIRWEDGKLFLSDSGYM
jgi:hypothetical protein